MPLSTVCVSTVSNRPRTWSSYTNIRTRDEEDLVNMNATEEITVYKDPNNAYQSPTLGRRTIGYCYDFPEKPAKKDKKWSISSIFRRKKKEESESSSEEEASTKKGFLNRSRRKKPEGKKKKLVKTLVAFDHVVIPPCPRNSMHINGNHFIDDNAVLSDPTGGFSTYTGRPLPLYAKDQAIDLPNSIASVGSGSVDSVNKRSRKELVKARAEARRTSSRNGSSSDEDSMRSNSSLHIRSEENLKARDTPTNRRSRAARTERYLKRHSRDGENPYNYLRLSKSDAENTTTNTSNWKLSDDSNRSPSRSPLVPSSTSNAKTKLSFTSLSSQNTNFSGLSTIPPSHSTSNRFRVSNSTSNPQYKQSAQSMNDYNNSTNKKPIIEKGNLYPDQRSFSYDANIHKAPSAELTEAVLNVQLPIIRSNNRGYRNLSLIDPAHFNRLKQPPPPPPRDPNRTIGVHYFEGTRPNSYYFDSSGQSRTRSFNGLTPHPVMAQTRKFNSFNLNPNLRSTSEDYLPRDQPSVQLTARPSSTTPDSGNPQQRYITRRSGTVATGDEVNYLADKNPRSRKPIFVQYGNKSLEKSIPAKQTEISGSQKALDFWKQMDQQNLSFDKPVLNKNRSESPQIFTSHTRLQTQVFLPSVLQNDFNNPDDNRTTSPFKPITPTTPTMMEPTYNTEEKSSESRSDQTEKDEIKRKSSNLEEALDELEAIYNSLRLGDDDLLERAEQRERESQARKCQQPHVNQFPNYSARGALSDSNFSYEPFDSVDSPRRKRLMRKHKTVDIKNDDMAFRKLNKERASTISDPQSVISKVSYLLSSPIHAANNEDDLEDKSGTNNKTNEPDITYDDVVYRNIKHANNSLRVTEPQPPFGIPIGPITPAANSDYLHAKPENIYKPIFKHKKIPDIVKDDLAFRNLRKDCNKGPALPPLSVEDYRNNNSESLTYLRKKRAQRSLSANIGNLIQNENRNNQKRHDGDVENEFKTLTDIADAMEIARRVLKEKENRISSTRKAFMSDTDTQYIENPEHVNNIRTERRNFLNGLRAKTLDSGCNVAKPSSPRLGENLLLAKPPRGTPEKRRSPKESTPIPVSPMEERKSVKSESTSSSLDDLLNALAEEAKETTERITNELKLLAEQNEKRSSLKRDEEHMKKNDELFKKLSDIDAVSEQAKLCEKLLESVVDSSDLITSEQEPEDEQVEQIQEENETVGESANIVLTRIDTKEDRDIEDSKLSDHDYENLISDKELNIDDVKIDAEEEDDTKCTEEEEGTCRSPFEEHKQELIASFQELKDNMDSVKFPCKRTSSEEKQLVVESGSSKVESIYDNVEDADENDKGVTGEEACGPVFDIVALPTKECAFKLNANPLDTDQMFTSNCDIVLRKPNSFLLHDDSETSSGFHSNCSCGGESSHHCKPEVPFEDFGSANNLDSLESLKSPKLVLETANKVLARDESDDTITGNVPRSSRLVLEAAQDLSKASTSLDSRSNRDDTNSRSIRHCSDIADGDDVKSSASWYRDPTTVAFACSYGIACAHQLAHLDLFAILSILLAVISFIATLFL